MIFSSISTVTLLSSIIILNCCCFSFHFVILNNQSTKSANPQSYFICLKCYNLQMKSLLLNTKILKCSACSINGFVLFMN